MRGPFTIGEGEGAVSIPVYTYAKTLTQMMPSLKRKSLLNVNPDEEEEEQKAANARSVKMEKTYWNKAGDEDEEVGVADKLISYKYGKQLIPFLEIDKEVLSYSAPKGVALIGFCHKDQIKRHTYMLGTDCMVAEPGNTHAAVSICVSACIYTHTYMHCILLANNSIHPLTLHLATCNALTL